MDKFIENVLRKKQKDEDLENRKKEVFGTGNKKVSYMINEKGQKVTKVSPFNIKEASHNKLEKTRKEIEDQYKTECTFKPKTLEGVNKNLIMEVLNELDDDQ